MAVKYTKEFNQEGARRGVFEYIEVFYNRIRCHSALDYVSPAEFELARVA